MNAVSETSNASSQPQSKDKPAGKHATLLKWAKIVFTLFFFIAVPRPRRSSAQLAAAPARPGFLAVAAVVLLVATLLVSTLIPSHAPKS